MNDRLTQIFKEQSVQAITFYTNASALFRRVAEIEFDWSSLNKDLASYNPNLAAWVAQQISDYLHSNKAWASIGQSDGLHRAGMEPENIFASAPGLWVLFCVHPTEDIRALAISKIDQIRSSFHFALLLTGLIDSSEQVRTVTRTTIRRLLQSPDFEHAFLTRFINQAFGAIAENEKLPKSSLGYPLLLDIPDVKAFFQYRIFSKSPHAYVEPAQTLLKTNFFDRSLERLFKSASNPKIRLAIANHSGGYIEAGLTISTSQSHIKIVKLCLSDPNPELQSYALDYLIENPDCSLHRDPKLRLLANSKNTQIARKALTLVTR